MRILLWRNWAPLFEFPATFSSLEHYSVGGTCSQLLWHARKLAQMGHQIQVLGATGITVWEEGVEFVGSSGAQQQRDLIVSGKIVAPDIVLLEGAHGAARLFRESFVNAYIVHVGQNIDRYGAKGAFNEERFIDRYAMVSSGHLAHCCGQYPGLRHKFGLLRNIASDERVIHESVPPVVTGKVVWVGNWNKKGLRQWAETMAEVMCKRSNVTWRLFGPAYDRAGTPVPSHLFSGLSFPLDRMRMASVPVRRLLAELASAQIVITSLGNETAGISTLDAQSVGRPVISGNDLVYKFTNPDGCGLRVTSAAERRDAICGLLDDADLCDELGAAGREHVERSFTSRSLEADLAELIRCQRVHGRVRSLSNPAPSRLADVFRDAADRVQRRILAVSRPVGKSAVGVVRSES